jgi:acetoin utilization deacetylase AcuC-like enzyme
METALQPLGLIDVAPTQSEILSSQKENHIKKPFMTGYLSHARSLLAEVHSEELVESLETKCRTSKDRRIEEGENALGFIGYLDDDKFMTTESYDVCFRATASWIESVDQVFNANANNYAMALTRPPGHHAIWT